jgi:hypothetical protein
MKMSELKVRLIALIAATCCSIGIGARSASAQTVAVSPSSRSLSFGVPTGSTTSAPQAVTISVSGSGSVTVSNIGITVVNATTTGPNDFMETNTCANPIAAPGSCAISVTFTPSATAGVLESATLRFSTGGESNFSVALTGALGAIRLFDPINVATSNPSATFSNLVTLGSTTLNLSCPANATATISLKPDGSGNVVVDNYITLVVNNQPFGTGQPAGNVCTGGVSDLNGNITQQNCFTQSYRDAAGNFGANGDDPDNFATTWGVAPINLASAFVNEGGPTTPTATFTELDAGVVYTGTTLFLATNCSLTNANTGSETGNPINQQPVQTLSFDTVPNNLDQFIFDYSFAFAGTGATNTNSTPTVTNNSITPNAYKNLVMGTPFQNTTCIPLQSLSGNCALKTQVCTLAGGSTTSGENCPQSTTPDILFTTVFDPKTLITDPNTIFGFLEFNDLGNCTGGLEGPEANSSCPQNGLVSFTGPGEYSGRRGAGSTNSAMTAVTGVNPPNTTVVVTPSFPAGPPSTVWTNGHPQVQLTGNPGASTPVVAPINFIEYGVNAATSGLPPTFPIPFTGNGTFPADTQLSNTACPTGSNPYGPTASPFAPPSFSLGPFVDGASNLLHYSTTDCANTHELQFSFNDSKWSTSFKSLTLMTDTAAPTINVATPMSAANYTAGQKVKAAYSCTDTESGPATCTGTVANGSNIDTTPTSGLSTIKTFTVTSADNVGNTATPVTVNYSVSCSYAAVTINPSSVTRPAFVAVTASLTDCMSAPQNVKVRFSLSGPIGRKCTNSSVVLFTTPTFTIKSGTSNSFTFPFPIGRDACVGTYTFTTTTLQGPSNTVIDTVSSTLMVN